MASPVMVEIELGVTGVGAEVALNKFLHLLLPNLLSVKISLLQSFFNPCVYGKGFEKIERIEEDAISALLSNSGKTHQPLFSLFVCHLSKCEELVSINTPARFDQILPPEARSPLFH